MQKLKTTSINYIFPITFLTNISKKNKSLTYSVFLIYIFLSAVFGKKPSDPTKFFYPGESFLWDIYLFILDFLYSLPGRVFSALVMSLLFLWFIYIFTDIKKNRTFTTFILPFISLAFLGVVFQIINAIFYFIKFKLPIIGLVKNIYLIIYFSLVLKNEFRVTMLRGLRSILLAFLLLVLCTFAIVPGIGYLLQEIP